MGSASGKAVDATAKTAQHRSRAGARGRSARDKRHKRRAARPKEASNSSARADAARASLGACQPRGILKRCRDKDAPQAKKSWFASLIPERLGGGKGKISFVRRVEVAEYTRCLNQETVPGDGTLVTMGLGRLHRRTSAALAPGTPAPDKPPVEESAWLTSAERVKVLRKSMGDKHFFGAWVHARRSTMRISAERLRSRADGADQAPMPGSLDEARIRAQCLAFEAAVAAAELNSAGHATKLRSSTYKLDGRPGTSMSKLAGSPANRSAVRTIMLPCSKRRRSAHKRRRSMGVQAGDNAQTSGKLAACKPQFPTVPPGTGPRVDDLTAWCTFRLPAMS